MPADRRAVRFRGLFALCLCTVLAGCATVRQGRHSGDALSLSSQDEAFAASLAHYSSALLLEKEGRRNVEPALRHYEEALHLTPEQPRLYMRLAHAAIRSGDFERALSVLEEGRLACPDSAPLRMELAAAYQLKNRPGDAEKEYLEALELDGALTYAYLAVAAINFRAGRDGDALDILGIGLEDAKVPRLLLRGCHQQGAKFFQAREWARAIRCFKFGAEHAPEQSSELYHIIAEIYRTQRDIEQARKYYELSASADDPIPDAFIKLALLRHDEDPQAAINILTRALQRIPATPKLLNVLGELHRRAGQTEDALALLTEAVKKDPPLPQAFIGLAVLHLDDDPDKALEVLERGANRLPENPALLQLLANLYTFRERFEDAVKIYERVEVIAAANDKVKLAPDFYLHYGSACERGKQFKKAARIFSLGIERHPDAHRVRNYLAYMWAERAENLDEALVHINHALELDPENGAYIDTLGWVYYQQGRYPDALEQLQKAVKLVTDDPVLHDHLGDVLDKLGRAEEATKYWRASFIADPKSESVKKKLEQLGLDIDALKAEAEKVRETKEKKQEQDDEGKEEDEGQETE